MPRLPREIDTATAIRVFERAGFERTGQRKGAHEKLRRPGHEKHIEVKHPTMRIGLLRSLIRDAGMTPAGFMEIYDSL